jgi:hypothetical protein
MFRGAAWKVWEDVAAWQREKYPHLVSMIGG